MKAIDLIRKEFDKMPKTFEEYVEGMYYRGNICPSDFDFEEIGCGMASCRECWNHAFNSEVKENE